MRRQTIAVRMARHFCGLSFSDLPADRVSRLKDYLLDWLGSAFAGRGFPPVEMMRRASASLAGPAEATSIPDYGRTGCLRAALLNGAASHMVEMDDLHREAIIHPAAPIMPAALAASEAAACSGKGLLLAISAGYEAAIRIALAVGPSHYRLWHTTATCGTFGAAAAAAVAFGLDEERFAWALGSAGTQAAGLWEFLGEGAMSKQLHAGKAAMNGLFSALLAKEGFTGATGILEGEKGFFKATSSQARAEACLEGLGKTFPSDANSLKFHASCGHTHSAIDAALAALGGRTIGPQEVREVELHIYQAALDLLEDIEPATPYAAKFSLPFCLATALVYGRVGLEAFTEERLRDGAILALREKIRLKADPALTAAYPRAWPARVAVLLADGRVLEGACDYPRGDPQNPLTRGELSAKFKSLTRESLSPHMAGAVIERVFRLEELGDVNDLLAGTGAADRSLAGGCMEGG